MWLNLLKIERKHNQITLWETNSWVKEFGLCKDIMLVSHCAGCPPSCLLTSVDAGNKHKHVHLMICPSASYFCCVLCAMHTVGTGDFIALGLKPQLQYKVSVLKTNRASLKVLKWSHWLLHNDCDTGSHLQCY